MPISTNILPFLQGLVYRRVFYAIVWTISIKAAFVETRKPKYGTVVWGEDMYTKIRALREEAHLSQTQVAEHLIMSQTGYSKYETGENAVPSEILIKLAKFYGTRVDYLLGLTEERSPHR